MLSHGSPQNVQFSFGFPSVKWKNIDYSSVGSWRKKLCKKKKNNLKSQPVGTRLTESLKKLIESLDLCWQEANGYEQMDRLEQRSRNSDRQNNHPPTYENVSVSVMVWLIRHGSITRRGGKHLIHCCTTLCRGVLPDFPERWLLYVIEVCD